VRVNANGTHQFHKKRWCEGFVGYRTQERFLEIRVL
jgi:hypothetical protein